MTARDTLFAALVIAIGALALALRLYDLSRRSLWLDEIATATASSLPTPGEVIAWSQADINGMPLFYLLTWLLARWGDSEALLRLPSVIAGTLTVLALYLLGKRLFGVRAGVIAALLFSVLPFAVWYSQEARNYALLMLMTTLQMLFAYNAVKRGRAADWLGLAAFTTLNLYTHYLALAVTAAVAVYVGIFVLTGLQERASSAAKSVVVAVLIVLAGVAVLVRWRAVLKPLVGYLGREAAQHRVGALLAAAVILAVLAAVLVVGVRLAIDRLHSPPEAIRRLAMAAGCGILVLLAYSPWLPYLRVFLGSPEQSVSRYDQLHRPTLGDVIALLGGLDLSGIPLAAFGLGLLAIAFWLFRGRRAESALLLCWIGVPVLVLWLSLRGAIVITEVRYFAFLVPAWVLVAAAGFEAAVTGTRWAIRQLGWGPRLSPAATAIAVLLAALLVAQPAAAALASYQIPKHDWRAVASHIATSSPSGSTVIAVGDYSDFAVLSLNYYFKRLRAPVVVVDGRRLDSDVTDRLIRPDEAVWGVTVLQTPGQLALIAHAAEERTEFLDQTGFIRVVRPVDAGLSPIEQARTLLRWQLPLAPALNASLQVLDLLSGRADKGQNLVANPTGGGLGQDGWGPSGPDLRLRGDGLLLAPNAARPEVDALYRTDVRAGRAYLLSFDCRNGALAGSQLVYASAFDSSGRLLFTFPNGGGYRCAHSEAWKHAYFGFEVPIATSQVVLLLRARGRGEAAFRAVELNPITSHGI